VLSCVCVHMCVFVCEEHVMPMDLGRNDVGKVCVCCRVCVFICVCVCVCVRST